jgi:hypothetical protein
MTVEQMREALYRAYPGEKWRTRVSKMAAGQIVAIYLSFKKDGII